MKLSIFKYFRKMNNPEPSETGNGEGGTGDGKKDGEEEEESTGRTSPPAPPIKSKEWLKSRAGRRAAAREAAGK